MSKQRVISLAVREFALPVPRVGSIEAHSGFGRLPEEGLVIHQAIQEKRAANDSRYRAEVPSKQEFERGGYRFRIGGRIDGFFETDPPRIEEIKTSFSLDELENKIAYGKDTHP